MQLEHLQARQRSAPSRIAAPGSWTALAVRAAALLVLLALAGPARGQDETAPLDAEPQEDDVQVAGSLQARATVGGGSDKDQIATRLGLEWLVHRWSGGFSLELTNDRGGHSLLGRDGTGQMELSERWIGWTSRGPHRVELRLGTARGVTFGEGLVLGSPTFDGIAVTAQVTPHQTLIALAGRTESLNPDDLVEDEQILFPSDDELGRNGELAGLRHEIRRGNSVVGINLVHAQAEKTDPADLLSADWGFSRGKVDFSAELAGRAGGGWGVFTRTSVTASDRWGVTVETRRYAHFASPLDSAPRYEGLSSADERDETGALARIDFAPAQRFSGSVSFDWSEGGDASALKSASRKDARLALRWAISESTSLAYGFEIEDLATGYDGRVHSLLLTQSFKKLGRLSARLSVDRATAEPRDGLRVSWRVPLMARKVTLLLDATVRREKTTTREVQAGASFRLGASSFLTARVTVADDEPESVDLTWYRRF